MRFLLLGLLVGVVVGAAGQPPVARSWVVYVQSGTTVQFSLWDPPEQADALGYEFTVIVPPAYGRLGGTPPVLSYTPSPGFYGRDHLQYVVQDRQGHVDSGTVRIVVLPAVTLGRPPVPGLSVAYRGGFAADALGVNLSRFEASLTARTGFLEQGFRAVGNELGLTEVAATSRVTLVGVGVAGFEIPLSVHLTFNPSLPGLSSAAAAGRAGFGDLHTAFTATYYAANPSLSSLVLVGTTLVGELMVEVRGSWRFIPVEFDTLTVLLRGPGPAFGCPNCPLQLEVAFSFTKSNGLRELRGRLRNLPLPCPACATLRAVLDLDISFTAAEKKLEPTLRLESPLDLCVRPLVELVPRASGLGWAGVRLYGFEVKCTFVGGYEFRAATSFADEKNAAVTGDARFFEVWRIVGPVGSCCGPQGWWRLSTYFVRTSDNLFGWGMSEVELKLPFGYEFSLQLSARMGAVDPGDPGKTWSVKLELSALLGG